MAMLCGIAIFYARPAYRNTTQVTQPDGHRVTIRLVGDEYLHYNTTLDGYSLVRRDDGSYVYAQLNEDGQLEPTAMLAHDADERAAEERFFLESIGKQMPKLTERMSQMRQRNRAQRSRALSQAHAKQYDYQKFRGLVILVEYSDCAFRYGNYATIMEEMLNADHYTGNKYTNFNDNGTSVQCTGSMRDYYRDNSDGKFVPTFDVVGPVKVNCSQYYVNSTWYASELMIKACTAADSKVNFKDYDTDGDGMADMIYFIFAGLGSYIEGNDSRLLWPHQSDLSYENVRKDGVYLGRYACSNELFGSKSWSVLEGIGTMCHEFNHVLGLPDFYDTGYTGCVNPGNWSVMADGNDYNVGRTPCGLSLFERYALGFASPQVIGEVGEFSLNALHASNTGYRLDTPVKDEYFLIENRQKVKWDAGLPGHGMLIFRVDSTDSRPWYYNTVNNNHNHPYYELLRAGGMKSGTYNSYDDSGKDPFPGTKNVRIINNETSPSLKTWAGKPNNLGLRNIKEQAGIITFETYNVNILTSIRFANDNYKVSVGNKQQLTVILMPESAPCILSYTSDDESVATINADGWVTALSEGVAHISVHSDNNLTATCTVTVTPLSTIPDIASFRTLNEGDEALLKLTGAQVLYAYDGDIYLRDATGSLMLSGVGISVAKNDVLNGSIFGQFNYNNLMPQLTVTEAVSTEGDLFVEDGEEPQPIVLYGEELSADYYSNLVLVKGLTLVRDGGVYAEIDGRRVRLWNKFQIKSPKISLPSNIVGKYYDVTAIYGTDVIDGKVVDELYLLKSPVEGSAPDALRIPMAQGRTASHKYNILGQRVGTDYKGIVVKGGKKFVYR